MKWLFSEWDVNDDGLVSQDEFKDCLSVVCNPADLSWAEVCGEVVRCQKKKLNKFFTL